MVDIDTFQSMADEIAENLPEQFFRKLNGGIILHESARLHPESRAEAPLYIMGEYCRSSVGRCINLYYGSFTGSYPRYEGEEMRREIEKTLLHEFRHHLEWLSGTDELEKEDAAQLAAYRQKHGII